MKTKSIKIIIKEYFFINPNAKLRVRQIERTLALPLPSVIRYCKELVQEKILRIINIGNSKFYTADRTTDKYLLEKKIFNIFQIYNSGLINYLKKELSNPPIILFGSYAKGEDTEESDIDLFIETLSKKKVDLTIFEKKLKRKIQLFEHKSITDIKNKHLTNNILNGITLNNYVEVFK